jgi:DNA-binding NtrC family response regulator
LIKKPNDPQGGKLAKILYLDDMIEMRASISDLLEAYGYEVATAALVRDAEARLNHEPFDVIISDGQVETESDGSDFAVRAAAAGHKVIIVSGNNNNYRPGIPFLSKPYDADELISLIERVRAQP